MTLPDFSGVLREAMGLDAASIGASAVDSAVRTRLRALGIDDPHSYWSLLQASSAELQALIEAVVVPETWFFRDREAFSAMVQHITVEWLPEHPEDTLRLLSLPCSTGEEPYSMAMALLDAGFPLRRCRIDAVDISMQALTRARHGEYRNNSFRGADLTFRDRRFIAAGDCYRINDAVREPVRFQQRNLFSDGLLPGIAQYDVIFCRNLLIYFDRETQDRALQVLKRLLKPDGILFVGPSEGSLPLSHHFSPTRIPLSFAFRRCGVVSPPSQPARAEPATVARCHSRAPLLTPAPSVSRVGASNVVLLEQGPDETTLEKASELADQGLLVEAARICEESLRQHGPSPRAFHLLGLIASANGDPATASHYYRKALYLDLGHHDSLVHLSLLLENEGDTAGARILRDRLQRLQATSCAT